MWVSNYSSRILSSFLPCLVRLIICEGIYCQGKGKGALNRPGLPHSTLPHPCIPRRVLLFFSLAEHCSSVLLGSWASKGCFGEGCSLLTEWAACDWQWHSWFLQTPGNCWVGLTELRAPDGNASVPPTSAILVFSLSRYPGCRQDTTRGKLKRWPGSLWQ